MQPYKTEEKEKAAEEAFFPFGRKGGCIGNVIFMQSRTDGYAFLAGKPSVGIGQNDRQNEYKQNSYDKRHEIRVF